MEINWYPGHMARTRRQLSEQLGRVDLVIELCDARLPYSSRNPDLDSMLGNKKRILLMNKADLADPAVTDQWLKYFRNQGITVSTVNAMRANVRDSLAVIEKATREAAEKAASRGIRKTMKVMVAGVPNVGKSTYINRLHGGSIAVTGDRPGVTKNQQWVRISTYLELLDTPGLLWPRLDDQIAARRLCYIGSVKDEVVDLSQLTMHLLKELMILRPEAVCQRFHVDDATLQGVELLDAICKGRGFLMKGSEPDYDRCYAVVLDEFRAGKLGRISLEVPPVSGMN